MHATRPVGSASGLNTGSPARVSHTGLPSRMSTLASVRQAPAYPPGGHIQN
jgi:hypothetical protein